MGMNMCLFCEHCDSERTNDLEQVRCKKFSTYVDPLNWCDYFTNKETSFERIKNMSVEELADMLTVELVGLQPCKLFQALPTEKTYISKKAAVQDVENWLEKFGGYENENEGVNYGTPNFKVSSKCCYYLKEKPCDDWAKEHNSVLLKWLYSNIDELVDFDTFEFESESEDNNDVTNNRKRSIEIINDVRE